MSTCVAKFSQDRGQPRPPAALTAGAPSRTRLLGSPPQRCSGRLSFLFVGARAASELHVSRSRPTAEWSRRRRCLSPREPRSLRLSAFRTLATVAASGAELPPIDSIEAMPVMLNGELADLPPEPGVYAVYSPEMKLQYIGISRQVSSSVKGHMQDLPDLVGSIKFCVVPGEKDSLMAAWKAWVQQTVSSSGAVPPGNAPGIKDWTQGGTRTIKPELKLTPGGGLEHLTIPMEQVIQQVVDSHKVVVFIKGTRTDPACGFSFKVLSLLNSCKADYEVVNVLDEIHNPGLRLAIKDFSSWPTIPQLYINGEFVGGADIIVEMSENGELKKLVTGA